MEMNVPVLFLVFNRPYHTRQSFEALRKIKPAHLYIGADGPRIGNKNDEVKCAEVRKIFDTIDWECEVKKRFNEKNLGTKVAVSNAITWFFQQVEEGIVIEDDCIPDPTFYSFAARMLEKYRHQERIMHINGTNLLKGKEIVKSSSYYFSNFCHVWGWASWKRAWNNYDVNMKDFSSINKQEFMATISDDPSVSQYWYHCLEAVHAGRIDTWDYQWYYAFWKNKGIAITPSLNMVSNIGFDEEGTKTTSSLNRFSKMKTYPMKIIKDPEAITINREADRYSNYLRDKELNPSFWYKARFKINLIKKNLKARFL